MDSIIRDTRRAATTLARLYGHPWGDVIDYAFRHEYETGARSMTLREAAETARMANWAGDRPYPMDRRRWREADRGLASLQRLDWGGCARFWEAIALADGQGALNALEARISVERRSAPREGSHREPPAGIVPDDREDTEF